MGFRLSKLLRSHNLAHCNSLPHSEIELFFLELKVGASAREIKQTYKLKYHRAPLVIFIVGKFPYFDTSNIKYSIVFLIQQVIRDSENISVVIEAFSYGFRNLDRVCVTVLPRNMFWILVSAALFLDFVIAQPSSEPAGKNGLTNISEGSRDAESEGGTVSSHFKGSMGFFTESSLITVFANSPESNPAPELGELQEVTAEDKVKKSRNLQNHKTEEKQGLDNRAEIIKTFGDPSEVGKKISLEHLPKEAPPALRGFVAALNIGDRKLAEEYARAYGEYHKTLQRYLKTVADVTKAQSEIEEKGLTMEDLSKLPESVKRDLQKSVVEKVEIGLEQIKDAALKSNSAINEEDLVNPKSMLGLKHIVRSGSLEDLEYAADEIIRSNEILDSGFVVFILLRNPTSAQVLRAGFLYSELVGTFNNGVVNPVIVCSEGCSSQDVATLKGFFGANVLANNKSLADAFGQKEDFEVIIVGNTEGNTFKIFESNPRFLRILLSKAIKR